MAKKQTIDLIIKAFRELGGNVSDVLGSRTNVSFLGVGDNVEPFLDKNLNTEALGVLSQSKAIDEAKNAVGFAVGDKLNDIQAGNLLTNLNKMKEFYMPQPVANITDMATGTRDLTQEGLGALRATADDLPPPGSRGGPDDIAAPVASAEETFKNTQKTLREQINKLNEQEAGLGAQFEKIITNKGDAPSKRASAREFLVEALKKDEMDVGTSAFGKTQLNNVISAEDVRYITEGGGGIGGDPILLVEKYFGPRIAEALPSGASNEEILIFTKRVLENVTDAAGLKPDNPNFDRMTARFIDEFTPPGGGQPFAEGGRAGLRFGKLAGKAFGLAKKTAAINRSVDEGTQMGYGALRKYGIEAEDITRLFKEISMDSTLQGPEKTDYFKMLNQVLKNPDQFPDGIIEIKKRLGMDFAHGGLAKILEV